MRRIAITGMGIASCLGNDLDTVSAALREGLPGAGLFRAWGRTHEDGRAA